MLQGSLSCASSLGGALSAASGLGGNLTTGGAFFPRYEGSYEFEAKPVAQTVHTAGTVLMEDIVIDPVPSNYGLITYNGSTLTVS
jgi:hypothetical protein